MEIRTAEIADAEAIREIYNHEVTGSTVTFDLVPRTLAEQEAMSAATVDRYLKPVRDRMRIKGISTTKPSPLRAIRSVSAPVPTRRPRSPG